MTIDERISNDGGNKDGKNITEGNNETEYHADYQYLDNCRASFFPGTYGFSMTCVYGRQEKSQNIATNSTVVFQTGRIHSDSGRCTYYYSGGWRVFTQDREIMPGTYTFRFNDGTSDGSYTATAGTVNHIH